MKHAVKKCTNSDSSKLKKNSKPYERRKNQVYLHFKQAINCKIRHYKTPHTRFCECNRRWESAIFCVQCSESTHLAKGNRCSQVTSSHSYIGRGQPIRNMLTIIIDNIHNIQALSTNQLQQSILY